MRAEVPPALQLVGQLGEAHEIVVGPGPGVVDAACDVARDACESEVGAADRARHRSRRSTSPPAVIAVQIEAVSAAQGRPPGRRSARAAMVQRSDDLPQAQSAMALRTASIACCRCGESVLL